MDQELVNRIVKEVQAALGQAPGRGAAPAPRGMPQEESRTPEEKVQRHTSPRDVAPESAKSMKVFVTADALRRRVKEAADKHTAELAWNEVLTPNALDMVQQMRLEMRKKERPVSAVARTQASGASNPTDRPTTNPTTDPAISIARKPATRPTTSPGTRETKRSEGDPGHPSRTSESPCKCAIGLVVHRGDGKVSSVVDSIRGEGINLVEFNKTDCPLRNLAALCEAIRSGHVARGVVIARYGAGAMALAGKSRGIRPVQGTRPASVEAAMRQFAANLLVIEHAFSTFHEMRTMIRLFAAGAGGQPADKGLTEALARLEDR